MEFLVSCVDEDKLGSSVVEVPLLPELCADCGMELSHGCWRVPCNGGLPSLHVDGDGCWGQFLHVWQGILKGDVGDWGCCRGCSRGCQCSRGIELGHCCHHLEGLGVSSSGKSSFQCFCELEWLYLLFCLSVGAGTFTVGEAVPSLVVSCKFLVGVE